MRVVIFAPSLGVEDMAQLQGICLGSISARLQCGAECLSGIHQRGARVLTQCRMLRNTGFQFHFPHSQRKENLMLTTDVLERPKLLAVLCLHSWRDWGLRGVDQLGTRHLATQEEDTERPP